MASSSSHVRARSDEHDDESDFAKMMKSQRVDNDATSLVGQDAGMDKFDGRAVARLQTENAVQKGMYTFHVPPSVHSLMSREESATDRQHEVKRRTSMVGSTSSRRSSTIASRSACSVRVG